MYDYLIISVFVVLGVYIFFNFKKLIKEEPNIENEKAEESPIEQQLITDTVGVVQQVKEVKKAKKATIKKKVKKKTPRRRDL